MRSTFSIIFLAVFQLALGQFDSTTWGPKKWVPSHVRIGANGLRLIGSGVSEFKTSYEGMVEIDFHKYFLVFEYGHERNARRESFEYNSKGDFFRIGIDQNTIPYNKSGDVLSIGLRYAQSSYTDNITFEHSTLSGTVITQMENANLTARWMELDLGLRAKVLKNLTMGYQIRGKLFKSISGEGQLETFDIPGFGRHKKNGREIKRNTVGFDYYIYWTIPLRQKYIPPKPVEP